MVPCLCFWSHVSVFGPMFRFLVPGLDLSGKNKHPWCRNTLYSLGALFTMLGQLGGTLWILSSMNTEEFPTLSSDGFDETIWKMQEFLTSGNVATDLKLGEIFGVLGVTASGYSYNMQYLVLIEEVELTCGLEQLEVVSAVFPNLAQPAQLIHAAGESTVHYIPVQLDFRKNIAKIANAVPVTLYSRVTVNVEIVVLNCQKCNQCLEGRKSLGMFFEGVL